MTMIPRTNSPAARPRKRQIPVGVTPPADTRPPRNITAPTGTRVTPQRGTRREPSVRVCKCGCGQRFTPNVRAPHQKYFDDACRKRAHRRKQAKAGGAARRAPTLALATCAWCGCTFFAHTGKGAKHCKPSHRTAAAKARRAAAVEALIGDLGSMNADEAGLLVERQGMRTITRYLRSQGWQYDDAARRWVIPVSEAMAVNFGAYQYVQNEAT